MNIPCQRRILRYIPTFTYVVVRGGIYLFFMKGAKPPHTPVGDICQSFVTSLCHASGGIHDNGRILLMIRKARSLVWVLPTFASARRLQNVLALLKMVTGLLDMIVCFCLLGWDWCLIRGILEKMLKFFVKAVENWSFSILIFRTLWKFSMEIRRER